MWLTIPSLPIQCGTNETWRIAMKFSYQLFLCITEHSWWWPSIPSRHFRVPSVVCSVPDGHLLIQISWYCSRRGDFFYGHRYHLEHKCYHQLILHFWPHRDSMYIYIWSGVRAGTGQMGYCLSVGNKLGLLQCRRNLRSEGIVCWEG